MTGAIEKSCRGRGWRGLAVAVGGLFASYHVVMCIRITAASNNIMNTCTILVKAIIDGVTDNGRHGPEIGKARPEPVAFGEMGGVDLPRLARVKAFLGRILERPAVHIGNLWTVGANNSPEVARWNLPRQCRPWRNLERFHQLHLVLGNHIGQDSFVQFAGSKFWRQLLDLVTGNRLGLACQLASLGGCRGRN